MTNLQLQCEGAFGAGVLSHLLLSGSESDRLHSALCLPLITSNKTLLKKLLLDSGGLQFALQPLGRDSAPLPLRSLYLPLLSGFLTALTKTSQTQKLHIRCSDSKKPRLLSSCPYSTATYDLSFLLDDGETLPANRDAVSGENSSSEYFRALLNGAFGESNLRDSIPIKDVCADTLAPVLHRLHGCRSVAAATDGCRALSRLGEFDGSDRFEETRLGKAMVGACRFLVADLQKELEDFCVSLLQTSSSNFEKEDCKDSIEKTANQASDLDDKTQESSIVKSQKRKLADDPKVVDGGWFWRSLLPQIYWFSHTYSYSNLRRACLSCLLGAPFSQARVAQVLKKLAQEEDCVQTLRQDLVELVTEALSRK
ncbi:hypothetical protein WMY93_001597 [Mugilogobius chulae]|uniref:BTB domain-containing protein n=1 Tax=Mugilogobius chulae TaxID=88201 RepID=A0AAW0Q668_9GOBI